MRYRIRITDRPTTLLRAGLLTLLPILAAIVAACGSGNGGSAY